MGCNSSREKQIIQSLDSILCYYTEIPKLESLSLTSIAGEKDEENYYHFHADLNSSVLSPEDIKERKKVRSTFQYPVYLIAWKNEKKQILATGSLYFYPTFNERIAVLRDIMAHKIKITEGHFDSVILLSNLVKALTSIAFEINNADKVVFEGPADLFSELSTNGDLHLSKETYIQMKNEKFLMGLGPLPLPKGLFDTIGSGITSGISSVGTGLSSAGKFVGSTATKVGNVIVPKKEKVVKEGDIVELNQKSNQKEDDIRELKPEKEGIEEKRDEKVPKEE